MSPRRRRLDEALLHAEILVQQSRRDVDVDLAELRSGLRLTQALVERSAAMCPGSGGTPGRGSTCPTDSSPSQSYRYANEA